jgi:hypothetical protein
MLPRLPMRKLLENLSVPKGYQGWGTDHEDKWELKVDCYVDADFGGLFGVEDPMDPVCAKSRTHFVITWLIAHWHHGHPRNSRPPLPYLPEWQESCPEPKSERTHSSEGADDICQCKSS